MLSLPISVIICTKNAENTLVDCLKSVYENNPAEIIVVDGLSTDRTLEITKKFTSLIYSDGGRGTSYAHQLGAMKATKEYLAYIDADITLPCGTLITMFNELDEFGYAAIQAQIRAAKLSTYWERALQRHIEIISTRKNSIGLNTTLIKRDVVLKYGFDPAISIAGDDLDFFSRVIKGGEKFGTSSAFVYHYHRASLRNYVRQRHRNGRSRAQWFRKYTGSALNPRLWPPITMVYMVGYSVVKGKPDLILYFIIGGIAETAGTLKGLYELAFKNQ